MPAKTPSDPPGEMPGLPPLDYPSAETPSAKNPPGAQASASGRAQDRADDPARETGRGGSDPEPEAASGSNEAEAGFSEALHDGAELGRKMLAAFETNMTAGLGFAAAMAETTSVPDMIALSSRFAARQFETALTQGKDLWTVGEKLMGDAARGFAPAGGDDPEDAGRR